MQLSAVKAPSHPIHRLVPVKLMLIVPDSAFSTAEAREHRISLLFTLENEFRNWSGAVRPAGFCLAEGQFILTEPSFVVTINDGGDLHDRAKQIFAEFLAQVRCASQLWVLHEFVATNGVETK